MKTYQVVITETSQMVVDVEADSTADAEEIVEKKWNKSEYILDAGDFYGVGFCAKPLDKDRGIER